MTTCQAFICSIVVSCSFNAHAETDSTTLLERKIPTRKNIIFFPNDKGEVVFNHSIHAKKFKEDDCNLCHRTGHPAQEKVLTRFENNRIAHYFCKGCHRTAGIGPTECHECHNYKKKK